MRGDHPVGRAAQDEHRHAGAEAEHGHQAMSVAFHRVDYDAEALAGEMEAERLPAQFVETIRTGWWTTCLENLPAKERMRGRF